MRKVEKFLWRTIWAGRMVKGKLYYTEAEIKAIHPEAELIPGSGKIFEYAETEEEKNAAYQAMSRPGKNFLPE